MEVPCDLDRAGHEEERHDRSSSDPRAVLTTYLTFLEHKIGHLRGILCSTPSPRRPEQQHAIVSAELRCIIVQLVSIANDLATGASPAPDASPSTPPLCDGVVGSPSVSNAAHEQPGSDDSDHADEDEEAEHSPSSGQYEVIQIEKEEILAPHAHACKVCGKGFKRDANLRMHMRGHGDQYKTPTALAKPLSAPATAPETTAQRPERRFYYSCPYAGCKRNKEHRDFQPLKNPVCVKNHYRRSHCDKSHLCRRCGVKRFSVLADLRTHEKHCGRDRWVCSCGTTFARKDKLFAHVAVFDGHTPALPPPVNDDDDAAVHCSITDGIATITVPGSDELAPAAAEALNVNNMFSDFSVERSRDDGRGYLCSPVGIDFYGFDGFDLSRAVAMDF